MTRRSRWALATALVAVAALTAGCEDDVVEPTQYTTIEDEASLQATRDGVGEFFADVVATARDVSGGGGLRNGESVREVACDPIYPDNFRSLEIGGSFVVEGADPDDVRDRATDAWDGQGWQPKRSEDDRVFLEAEVGDGVRATAVATIERPSEGAEVVIVAVSAGTGCLKLPSGAD